MRVYLTFDDGLVEELKAYAARYGLHLYDAIKLAVRRGLEFDTGSAESTKQLRKKSY